MAAVEISAKRKEDDASTTVTYDFGDTLEDAVAKFGAETVFEKFKQSLTIDIQALIRAWLAGDPEKRGNLQEKVDAWKPGVRTVVPKSAMEKAKDALKAMSPEDVARVFALLKAQGSVE